MYFGANDDEPPRVQRILPNGEVGLCFYRGRAVVYDGIGPVRSCLSGQLMHYQDIVSSGPIDIVGVHLTTIGAHVLLCRPMSDIGSHVVSLQDLNDADLLRLEQLIAAAGDYEACFALMDTFFLRRLATTTIDTLNIRRICRALAYGGCHTADAHIPDIASEACVSERQFTRLFTRMVGIAPKEYLRLQRFHSALHALKGAVLLPEGSSPSDTLAQIAMSQGYCDYAHLYADFRKISGYTPRQLVELSANDDDAYGWRM